MDSVSLETIIFSGFILLMALIQFNNGRLTMLTLHGYLLYCDNNEWNADAFRKQYLEPICGEQKSHRVLQGFVYMACAYCVCDVARERLERKDEFGPYLEYVDFGVYLQFQCKCFDNICSIFVIKCKHYSSRP